MMMTAQYTTAKTTIHAGMYVCNMDAIVGKGGDLAPLP